MKRIFFITIILLVSQSTFGQDKKIDQLEILYDQGYYRKVLRKSKRLLAKPEYDYSGLPSYYKALSLFRLADDRRWYKHHDDCIDDAIEAYNDFENHPSIDDYKYAHYYEISAIKTYLEKLGRELKELGYHEDADKLIDFNIQHFHDIKAKPDKHEIMNNPDVANKDTDGELNQRERIVVYAKSLIGIKYVWAGADENGFDCSGFTAYVLRKYGFVLPRTASGQLEKSKRVKLKHAQKADLVFFGSGAKITHVGLTVSSQGEQLTMIHASTSRGVIVTNIEKSTYWKPKLKAAGTYLG